MTMELTPIVLDRFNEMNKMMRAWGWKISDTNDEAGYNEWTIENEKYGLLATSYDFEKLFAYADGHHMGVTNSKNLIQHFNDFSRRNER